MQTAPSNGVRSRRSRSPAGESNGTLPAYLPQGTAIQFFHAADPAKRGAPLVRPSSAVVFDKLWLLQSHGWFPGTLQAGFDTAALDLDNQATWPLVLPSPDIRLLDKGSKPAHAGPRRVCLIREPSNKEAPLLSIVFIRWGGEYSSWMDEQEANDGDWGRYGSPPSDGYMAAVVEEGILQHPRLVSSKDRRDFEIFQLFVDSSKAMWDVANGAPLLAKALRGRKRACFWMLWPAEWRDTGDPDFACYVERNALFGAMRACEVAGLRSAFPHPADQFEVITSKSWMATMSVHPGAHLPAATLVGKHAVVTDPEATAKRALAALEHIRSLCPFEVLPGEPPAPSVANKDGVRKGVVKLGWSWENRFVLTFNNIAQLQSRLVEMMTIPGCTSSYCIVQEWVDFDFEMRQYFLPPGVLVPGERVEPKRIECNAWGERDEAGGPGSCRASFSKLSETQALTRWSQDEKAWASAKQQATDIAQLLIAWLLAVNAELVPMIRLDFMIKRLGPGKARVFFGEYCEMGACCLGWQQGPPTIWRAALDGALR